MRKGALAIGALCLLPLPLGAGDIPSVELPAPLARVLTDYEAAWQAKDAAALAALFVEDGFVLSRGVPPIRGRAAIARHYTGQVWGMMASYSHLAGRPFDTIERRLIRGSLRILLAWHVS